MQLLTQVVIPLLPPMTQLSLAVLGVAIAMLPLVTTALTLVTKILTPMVPLITQMANEMSQAIGVVALLATGIADVVGAGVNWITNVGNLKGAWSDFTGWLSGVPETNPRVLSNT